MESKYPLLEIDLNGIYSNAKKVVEVCKKENIQVCGVVKGTDSYENSYVNIAEQLMKAGCTSIGDSRMDTIARMREKGFQSPVLLLRVPMLSEVKDVVRYADISLQSEPETIAAINEAALSQGKIHKVILMMDLGDLREGFFEETELIANAVRVEKEMNGLFLLGIGVNLGCYGAIKPDVTNLGRLVSIAEKIEKEIARELDVISGGGTSTLPLTLSGTVPKRINHLRVGEGIILARDLDDIWHDNIPGLTKQNYVVKAQIIEIKDKPSYPIGEIFIDAFGNTPEYEDLGIRKRALLALGKRDIADTERLIPRLKGIKVMGGSSDHTILDITECETKLSLGDIVTFDIYYEAMIHAAHSNSVTIEYV